MLKIESYRKREPSPEMEHCLAVLSKASRKMRESRWRSAPARYLKKVYKIFWTWEQMEVAKLKSWTLARHTGMPFNPGDHPVKILIDTTSGIDERKVRSGWARALRFAASKNIEPEALRTFLRQEGGIAGCAEKFTACSSCKPDPWHEQSQERARAERKLAGIAQLVLHR